VKRTAVRAIMRRACSERVVVGCFELVDGGETRRWSMVVVWNVLLSR
jgi:hypothetical protein